MCDHGGGTQGSAILAWCKITQKGCACPPAPAAPCTGRPSDPPRLVLLHPVSGPPPCLPLLYHPCPHRRPALPAPTFCRGWKGDGRGLAKSNICGRLAKSPPESWFWRGAPLQLSPARRAGLAGVGSGMSIPPLQGWEVTAQPDPLRGKSRRGEGGDVPEPLQIDLDAGPAPFHGAACHLDGVAVSHLSPSIQGPPGG